MMAPISAPELAIVLLLAAIYAIPVCRIARKMGFPGVLGILALVPGVNLVVAYYLAFTDWPAMRRR
jgi:hypothetical protein